MPRTKETKRTIIKDKDGNIMNVVREEVTKDKDGNIVNIVRKEVTDQPSDANEAEENGQLDADVDSKGEQKEEELTTRHEDRTTGQFSFGKRISEIEIALHLRDIDLEATGSPGQNKNTEKTSPLLKKYEEYPKYKKGGAKLYEFDKDTNFSRFGTAKINPSVIPLFIESNFEEFIQKQVEYQQSKQQSTDETNTVPPQIRCYHTAVNYHSLNTQNQQFVKLHSDICTGKSNNQNARQLIYVIHRKRIKAATMSRLPIQRSGVNEDRRMTPFEFCLEDDDKDSFHSDFDLKSNCSNEAFSDVIVHDYILPFLETVMPLNITIKKERIKFVKEWNRFITFVSQDAKYFMDLGPGKSCSKIIGDTMDDVGSNYHDFWRKFQRKCFIRFSVIEGLHRTQSIVSLASSLTAERLKNLMTYSSEQHLSAKMTWFRIPVSKTTKAAGGNLKISRIPPTNLTWLEQTEKFKQISEKSSRQTVVIVSPGLDLLRKTTKHIIETVIQDNRATNVYRNCLHSTLSKAFKDKASATFTWKRLLEVMNPLYKKLYMYLINTYVDVTVPGYEDSEITSQLCNGVASKTVSEWTQKRLGTYNCNSIDKLPFWCLTEKYSHPWIYGQLVGAKDNRFKYDDLWAAFTDKGWTMSMPHFFDDIMLSQQKKGAGMTVNMWLVLHLSVMYVINPYLKNALGRVLTRSTSEGVIANQYDFKEGQTTDKDKKRSFMDYKCLCEFEDKYTLFTYDCPIYLLFY